MIHASWVWVAWVARAMSGRATFSDDIAATTAASATRRPPRSPRRYGARACGPGLRRGGGSLRVISGS